MKYLSVPNGRGDAAAVLISCTTQSGCTRRALSADQGSPQGTSYPWPMVRGFDTWAMSNLVNPYSPRFFIKNSPRVRMPPFQEQAETV